MDATRFIEQFSADARMRFIETKRLLTFDEYMQIVFEHPERFLRGAERYLLDMMNFYGKDEDTGRFHLFDAPFGDKKDALIGQEEVQAEIYRLVNGFVQGGRANKVIVLIGPNGSSKSSIVRSIMRALEHYSTTDEGALYRFNWVFPLSDIEDSRLGFARDEQASKPKQERSYALLDERYVAAKIPCELRDPPIFLIPQDQRKKLIETLAKQNSSLLSHPISEYVVEGDLSPKNKSILDALLNAYSGDYARVLRHVQVERYYFSMRYKCGAVSIEPQMSVDASIRQVAADMRYSNLPPILRSVVMIESFGKLIDANHGVLEFSDLLKRPIDSFKYLLATCETGNINLDYVILSLNLVFLASSNDEYLEAFKQMPEFPSFKGRMEFIRVPYLLDWKKERMIYLHQIPLLSNSNKIAPHTVDLAALWAVMTRMRRPNVSKYPAELRNLVRRLSPLDKAMLYAGEVPAWAKEQEKPLLSNIARLMKDEFKLDSAYEGLIGVSPRTVKQLLLDVADAVRDGVITPVRLFSEISELILEKSFYRFLQVESDGDFMNHTRLLHLLRSYYLDLLDAEVKDSLQLVEPSQYEELLRRYIEHVSAFIKGDKIQNPHTRKWEPPSEQLMQSVEDKLGIGDAERKPFREAVLSRIAAYSLEHPGAEIDIALVFSLELEKLQRDYFLRQKKTIAKVLGFALSLLAGERIEISDEERAQAELLMSNLQSMYGYPSDSLPEVLDFLKKHYYVESA